jgi:rhamnosyltransferase
MLEYISMNISVIIPTHNAGPSLQELLFRLTRQDLPPKEIIVIDSSSSDTTTEIAKENGAFVMTIPKESFDHGRTRNTAASKAKGEILVFMTQDALPANASLIRLLTDPLRQGEIVATCGRHLPKDDASPLEIFARHFNYPAQGSVKGIDDIQKYGIKTFFFSNVCSAFRKDLFVKIGMFPEKVKANEDMIIAARLILNGYRIAYIPEAAILHSHNYSLLNQFRRYYNIGSSLRNNRWIFRYARPEGEGVQFIKKQISYVLKQHNYRWVPYIFLEMIMKYAGYRMGLLAG